MLIFKAFRDASIFLSPPLPSPTHTPFVLKRQIRMIFILQAFLLYSEYEFGKCACFLWISTFTFFKVNVISATRTWRESNCLVRRSSNPRTEVSPAKLAFRNTASRNSPGAVSLKLVPPGQGNLCPEPRTPKGNLFSVARTPGLFETPRFFCRPLPLPHTHTVYFEKTKYE